MGEIEVYAEGLLRESRDSLRDIGKIRSIGHDHTAGNLSEGHQSENTVITIPKAAEIVCIDDDMNNRPAFCPML
jgi:hypothetical protein